MEAPIRSLELQRYQLLLVEPYLSPSLIIFNT